MLRPCQVKVYVPDGYGPWASVATFCPAIFVNGQFHLSPSLQVDADHRRLVKGIGEILREIESRRPGVHLRLVHSGINRRRGGDQGEIGDIRHTLQITEDSHRINLEREIGVGYAKSGQGDFHGLPALICKINC